MSGRLRLLLRGSRREGHVVRERALACQGGQTAISPCDPQPRVTLALSRLIPTLGVYLRLVFHNSKFVAKRTIVWRVSVARR